MVKSGGLLAAALPTAIVAVSRTPSAAASPLPERHRQSSAASLLVMFAAGCQATDGPSAAYVATRGPVGGGGWVGEVWRVFAPALLDEQVVNPIGAGDTVSGVMLCALAEGASPPAALVQGMAAASASCGSLRGAEFTIARLDELAASIRAEPLDVQAGRVGDTFSAE